MTKLHLLPLFPVALFAMALLPACSHRESEENTHKNLPDDVKPVAQALLDDSAQAFASSIMYPLERPYPLRSIKDSAEMVGYYPTMVDDSLKSIVRSSPDTLWQQIGWRGWTLDNGCYLWVDNGKVYSMNYISSRESHLLDSLRHEEMESLAPDMRAGWIPVLCIADTVSGSIFRIDCDDDEEPSHYRLAGYAPDSDLDGKPSLMLYGTLDYEGSMAVRHYYFCDSIGNTAAYSPDVLSDEDTVPEIEVVKAGEIKRYKVISDYWLDHVRQKKNTGSTVIKVESDSVRDSD